MASFEEYVREQSLTADYVICCGDLTNRANPEGIQYAWSRLQDIKAWVSAREIYAVSGNHDMDSRFQSSKFDAKGQLMALRPAFPLNSDDLANKYWAKNFVTIEDQTLRLVLLNTSAYHGYNEEWQHGRVSDFTLQCLRNELVKSPNQRLNILVCHHYPIKFGNIDRGDFSQIDGAEPLLELLGSGEVGRWLVVHGHRHWPHIMYAHGGSAAPVVFSAGSFSAVLYPDQHGHARNQFYILEFDTDDFSYDGCDIVGTFRAWDWAKNLGWMPASKESGLPHIGGFGDRTSGDNAARQITEIVEASGKPFMPWKDVTTQLPYLNHLIPSDMTRCIEVLVGRHHLQVLESDGLLKQVGRPQ
jgi:predicted phosphodiesterase